VDDALTLLSSRVVVLISGLLTSIIVARTVGAEGRGLIAAIIVVPQLVLSMAANGIGSGIAIHMGRKVWGTDQIVQTLVYLSAGSVLLGVAVSLAVILSFPADGYTLPLILASVCIVPGAVCYQYSAGVFLGLKRIPTFAIKAWGPGATKLLGTILLVYFLGFGVVGAVAAHAFSAFVIGVVLIWKLRSYLNVWPKFDPEIARALTRTGFSLSFVFLMMILVYRANVFLIQNYGTLEELGYYSIGTLLAELLWQLPTIVSPLILAGSASATDGLAYSRKVAALARVTLLIGVFASIIIAAFAPLIVQVLFGHEFLPSADIIRALLPGSVAIIVFKILRQDLSAKGRPWMALWIVLPMLATVILVGPFVIPQYGALGAAYTSSAVYVVGTAVFIALYSRVVGLSIREIIVFERKDYERLRGQITEKASLLVGRS